MAPVLTRHPFGITWQESDAMARAAHALSDGDRVWLIDPFDDAAALAAAAELGQAAGVIQLLDRHRRDGEEIAGRLGVPLLGVPGSLPDTPFEVVPVIDRRWWREVALWWGEPRVLVVAEALGTAPLFALRRRAGVHPLLRVTPPGDALGGYGAQWLLVGHGPPLQSGGAAAVREALDNARTDIPKLLTTLPSVIRQGRH